MKLLITTSVCDDIYRKGEFLKSKGIAIHFSDRGGASMKAGIEVGLWVILDSQFEDAVRLMGDRSYKVKNPLSVEEMINIEGSAHEDSLKILEKYVFKVGVAVLFFFVIVITIALVKR